ncbi:leucine Rich repeat-containing domain protein [Cooperia oncophora]
MLELRTVLGAVLAALVSLTVNVNAQCPPVSGPCRCAPSIYEPVAIICENAGSLSNALQAIQPARNTSIDSLMIIDTAISSIPANAFQSFTILRLVLNRNTLQFIDDQAFNGPLLDSLVELDLNDNNLGQIPQMGLTRLRNLRKLYLNRNRINTLSSNAFAGYESKDLIIKLSLAGNRLTDQSLTDTAVFRPLRLLQSFTILRLVLNRNTLQFIDDQAFNGPLLDSLVELDLNDNNLGQIPQMGLTRLRNLRKLYLNRNRINTLSSNAFAGYESKDLIIKLSLAGNRLTDQSLTDTAVFRPLRLLQG